MQFKLTYTEVENLISQKTGKKLPLVYGGPHTVRISYEVNVLFKTTSVGLDITVEGIRGSDIFLSYGGGMAIDMMVKTALSRVQGQPGADMLEQLDNSRLVLHLGKNPQLGQLFEHLVLQDIHFDEQSIMIDFVPKG